jgi:hypothetical protein
MSDIVDVAIMGTDPDRPKVAAHLRVDGGSYCHFDTGIGYLGMTGRTGPVMS